MVILPIAIACVAAVGAKLMHSSHQHTKGMLIPGKRLPSLFRNLKTSFCILN